MTKATEQERAEFLQMHADFEREFGPMPQDCKWSGTGFYQTSHHAWQAQEYAHKFDGFKAAWQAARRAPVVPDGYALISKDALRAWGKLDIVEAACVFPISETPQPSEADMGIPISQTNQQVEAPVQLPEPVAYLHECGKKPSLRTLEFSKVAIQLSAKGYKSLPLYTEQQVRELMASHGIK